MTATQETWPKMNVLDTHFSVGDDFDHTIKLSVLSAALDMARSEVQSSSKSFGPTHGRSRQFKLDFRIGFT
jgi:hypothetical protein